MFKYLDKYKEQGEFEYNVVDNLSSCCNAPRQGSGIYLIFADSARLDNLIYIGISGREGSQGEIIHRKDGLGGRIVKGKQFGEARRNSWSKKMKEDGFKKIIVMWYITHGQFNSDFPRPIEKKLLLILLLKNGKLPLWNNEL
ncbi:hypothetical protein ACFPH8_00285 [Bizionia hallyeonensis]|uniref:GIY-YIG domain-containing protein n=1 Tax=Bizionia hallyeonensis TaxID=1123757 RepID=A0ABW0C0I9_9FLAO